MRYPLNEIKTIHNDTKNVSITTMATKLLEAFPKLTQDIPYQSTAIEGSPEEIVFSDLGINQKVLNVAVTNLAAFLLADNPGYVGRIPLHHAEHLGDNDTVEFLQHLAKWVRGTDYHSVTNLVYLAHYEAEYRKNRRMDTDNIVLPGDAECKVIIQLADALMKGLNSVQPFLYRLEGDAAFNAVVNKGDIDFLVGDTIYISRLGRTYSRDRYYLLICYLLIKESPDYKDKEINHVCLVSPSDCICYSVDIRQVDKAVLDVIHGCIYGPVENTVVETSISRKRRVTLVTLLVALIDAKDDHETAVKEIGHVCNTYVSVVVVQDERIRDSYIAAINHFGNPIPKDMGEDPFYHEGIQLLNQLLVMIETCREETVKEVRLSKELVQDIFNKALDF